ncbi:MAG: amidohydrolase family protein, partial [Runella zeae]
GVGEKKGSLAKGKDADIVIFDKDITVSMTMVEGRVVYSNYQGGLKTKSTI